MSHLEGAAAIVPHNAGGQQRAKRVCRTAKFGARLASRSAYYTEAFRRNTKDAIRVSVLIHLLSDCLPDCPALDRRRLRQHGPEARGGGRTLRNELFDRAVFEGERVTFDRHLSEARLRERSRQALSFGARAAFESGDAWPNPRRVATALKVSRPAGILIP